MTAGSDMKTAESAHANGCETSTVLKTAVEALECTICLSLFVCPVTLACGHTFCKDCCEGALNRGRNSYCPLCRADIDATTLPAETVALRQLAQQCFPVKYAAAVAAKESARRSAADARASADSDSARALQAGIPWSQLPTGGDRVCNLCILTFSPRLLWPHQPIRIMIVEPSASTIVEELLNAEVRLIGIHPTCGDLSGHTGAARRGRGITGVELGTIGTVVAIGEIEQLCDSTGQTQYVLNGRGVARYEIAGFGGTDSPPPERSAQTYADVETGALVQYRPGRGMHRRCGFCRADVAVIDDDATHEPEEAAVHSRCTKRALSVWYALHPEARQSLEWEFGDLGAAHTRQHPFRVSCWLASALRLDQAGSPSLGQLLQNDDRQRWRLLTTRSTKERMQVCMEVLSKSVSFTDDDEVDGTASNYAIDHPSELFAIGQQPPAFVRLIQHSPNMALALIGFVLACWAHRP